MVFPRLGCGFFVGSHLTFVCSRLEGLVLRYWFCSSVGFSSSQEGLQECVLQYELTVGEEAETCQSIADCPPQPLQDPVGTDPVSEPKDGPGPVGEALKSGCSEDF